MLRATPPTGDDFDKAIADAQAAIDRGKKFGKSRLAANHRVMVGHHGVTKARAKGRAKRAEKLARRNQARFNRHQLDVKEAA